jgi:hypothetical protein
MKRVYVAVFVAVLLAVSLVNFSAILTNFGPKIALATEEAKQGHLFQEPGSNPPFYVCDCDWTPKNCTPCA